MNLPAEHSNVVVIGITDHLRDDGTLAIAVQSIAFPTAGGNPPAVGGGDLPPAPSPGKKRRFPTELSPKKTLQSG